MFWCVADDEDEDYKVVQEGVLSDEEMEEPEEEDEQDQFNKKTKYSYGYHWLCIPRWFTYLTTLSSWVI